MTSPSTKLAAVCELNPRLARTDKMTDELPVSFVPMSAVDEHEGRIVELQDRRFAEVRKGYTPFREGDVLFAKITPCMENGKVAIARGLRNGIGFGSTEFHILRAGADVLPEWLFYFVRRPSFRAEAKRNFTGSGGQQRVPNRFLEEAEIMVPPVEIQQQAVDLLTRAEAIVRLHRESQRKAQDFIPALFIDMFGDPATNAKEWPVKAFAEVGTLNRGRSRHRPRDAAELYGGPYPFIQTGEVANSGGRITSYRTTYSEVGLAQSRLWPKGTLCITIAANIAETGVLEFDACFPDSVVGFLPGADVRTEYVQGWLGFLQPTLEASAPQAAQKNINLEILRALPLPVPPVNLQEQFQQRCQAVFSIRRQQVAALEKAQAAFEALLARVFVASRDDCGEQRQCT